MSLSSHVHHFALVISIYDLVIFIDDAGAPPLNMSWVAEPSDEDDNEGGGDSGKKTRARAESIIDVNGDSSDEESAVGETAEAERDMVLQCESIRKHVDIECLMQTTLPKSGTHRFMHSSTQFRLLTMLATHLGMFTSLSATQRHVKVRVWPGDTSGGILIPLMGSQQATFAATRRCAGVKRLLQGRTL